MGNDGMAASAAPDPDITAINLSEFGEPATEQTRVVTPAFALAVLGAIVVAFVALVYLWYLGSMAFPKLEDFFGLVFALIALSACIFLIFFVLHRRVRWDTGVDRLVSELDFKKAELGLQVPHAAIPLQAVLERVRAIGAGFGPAVSVRETDPAKLKRAERFRQIGIGVAAAGVLIFLFGSVVIGAPVIFASSLLFIRATQASQPSLETLRAQDPRKPVLLLRSFRDDRLMARQRFHYLFWTFNPLRRFEQAIAGSFREFGPLIAIGEPGEKLPQLGAARTYLSNDEWQGKVLGWIEESRLIVMIAGTTQWITWELHRILEKDRFRHLLILVPPEGPKVMMKSKRVSTRANRWQNILDAFANTPWGPALTRVDLTDLLVVQLDPDGKVIAIRSSNTFVQDYLLAIAVAVYDEFGGAEATTAA